MLTIFNPDHALHQGKVEMFRGELVPCFEVPARGSDFKAWRGALAAALRGIAAHRPGALVVSLGVDTFEGDPVAGFGLQSADYLRIGEDLARADLPTVFVFEGGYAVAEISVNAVNVLEGFAQAAA